MTFPAEDKYWNDVRCFLRRHAGPLSRIFGPTEFLEFFPGTCSYYTDYIFQPEHFDFIVLPKVALSSIRPDFLLKVPKSFRIVHANATFVVYAMRNLPIGSKVDKWQMRQFLRHFKQLTKELPKPSSLESSNIAILVRTYNRPWALERSLPQITALGAPVLVVDDGSQADSVEENRRIAEAGGAKFLLIPENRGSCCASNTGLSYWLADERIEWISVFDDDVDVRRELLDVMAAVQDKHERPILTGRLAPEHKVYGKCKIAGVDVLLQRSAPGVHLHAHRNYWQNVMPIPTPYLGAPKVKGGHPGQGCDSDWWISAWAPKSISKQGKYLICIPGLVRHFANKAEQSSWGNGVLVDHPEDAEL